MSLHECAKCKGTKLICPSCSRPRQYGAPHRQCRPHKRCLDHTETQRRCDCCRAVMEEYNSFAFGTEYMDLCLACDVIARREMGFAKAVILDRIEELRATGTPPAVPPRHDPNRDS